jgi:carbamoyltransferase
MKDSPFMMYAVNLTNDKLGELPAITHVDGTCRIQTVSNTDNSYYHALISAFNKITGVPVLFNTSFNLAGEPLVETIGDAINTLRNSNINYLYLPEIGKLIKKA